MTTPAAQPDSKGAIIAATMQVLGDRELTGCSVEAIAEQAGCAKGLVNYHFRSKPALLLAAARRIGAERQDALAGAVRGREGTGALDALWQTLGREAASNRGRAWVTLLGRADTRVAMSPDPTSAARTASLVCRALGVAAEALPPELYHAALDGFSLRLLGSPPEDDRRVREAFDRFWLALIQEG